MKKKKIIVPISILLVICLVGGGVFTAIQIQNSKKTVDVVPVMNVSTYAYEGYSSSSGRVTSDVSQTVYLESEATVKEVYVQEGDSVTAGTPLMQYDTELMELDIDTKKLDIQTLELNIQQTNKDIQSLKNGVVPSGGSSLDIDSLIQPPASSEDNDNPKTSSALSGENPPTDQPAASGARTTQPTTQATEPITQATEPTTQATEPTTQATEPTTEATEPTTEATEPTTQATEPTTEASQPTTPSTPQASSEASDNTTDTVPPETEPADTFEENLNKDFDFSKYDANVNEDGEIIIPCSLTTKITPEFINLLRGKNADGSDKEPEPDPNNPGQMLPEKTLKVRLTFKDYDKQLLLDGSKLNEPFINTKAECTLQEFIDNNFQLPTDETALDAEFFKKWPQAETMNRTILIKATSETAITPEFIYILTGRNADGSPKENGVKHTVIVHLEDLDKNLELNGDKLALPYVTSIAGTLAEFIENELELPQEPVKELGKDTPLDVSHDHREVYEIYCDDSTIITKDFINRIREEKMTVILKIKDSSWITLDGSKMEAPSDKAIDTPIAEFIANGIALNEEQESTSDDIIDGGGDFGGIDIGGGGGISYTADEIKKMLSDKQLELAKLQTQKRQAQLDLAKLQKKLENATVTSAVNGVVTKLAVLDENTSTSDPFMVINSTEGLYLTGSINELDLDTLTVGQTISAMSWNTGASFDATIKEVSPYPASSSDNYGKNPNSSNYPFIALINNPPEGLTENEYVDITTGNNSMMDMNTEDQNLYIAKAYVRTDDNGESYIFAANSEGRLEKRPVVTGKVYSGSYIEITNNAVTQEDYIAFPYGKNVKEGVKTKIDDQNSYMYY